MTIQKISAINSINSQTKQNKTSKQPSFTSSTFAIEQKSTTLAGEWINKLLNRALGAYDSKTYSGYFNILKNAEASDAFGTIAKLIRHSVNNPHVLGNSTAVNPERLLIAGTANKSDTANHLSTHLRNNQKFIKAIDSILYRDIKHEKRPINRIINCDGQNYYIETVHESGQDKKSAIIGIIAKRLVD